MAASNVKRRLIIAAIAGFVLLELIIRASNWGGGPSKGIFDFFFLDFELLSIFGPIILISLAIFYLFYRTRGSGLKFSIKEGLVSLFIVCGIGVFLFLFYLYLTEG